MFNGELDLLEIRLNVCPADRFVIAESTLTFSGKPKPLYFQENKAQFEKWRDKIVPLTIDTYSEEVQALARSRKYVTNEAFFNAFCQKESINEYLKTICSDEDVIYYGDADEVWKPQTIDDKVYKLRQLAYSYYLNNRSSEDWQGTVVTKYKNLRNGSLNDMRAHPEHILQNGGWHFTNMGGIDEIRRKVQSYDHQEYNNFRTKMRLSSRLERNEDYLGRDFKMWKDETDLPEYIIANKEKYKRLWKS